MGVRRRNGHLLKWCQQSGFTAEVASESVVLLIEDRVALLLTKTPVVQAAREPLEIAVLPEPGPREVTGDWDFLAKVAHRLRQT